MTFVVRSVNHPEAQTSAVREQVWAVDKDQPVYNIRTVEQLLSESLAQRRLTMLLLGIFAGVALVLAVSGIYGVMSYVVAQRRHEIGVRMALGAGRMNVLRLIIKQGMSLVLIGIFIGLLASVVIMRTLASLLYGVSASDSLTFIGMSLLMIITALAACAIPAHRAIKVDPLVALRHE
jgi:putative ABC transport system permease protein